MTRRVGRLALALLAAVVTRGDARAIAQDAGPRPLALQPAIIVVPYVRAGESIRTVLDADFDRRVAIARVKDAFDRRGFPTVDFLSALRSVETSSAAALGAETDYRTKLFEPNRADVYVVVDVKLSRDADLAGATVVLQANLTANGLALATKDASSGSYRGVETERLVGRAADEAVGPLIDAMERRFGQFAEVGVPLTLEFRVGSGAAMNLDTPVGTPPRSVRSTIITWLDSAAFRGSYNLGAVTANLLSVPEVRLPLVDARGRALSRLRFSDSLVEYLRGVGMPNARYDLSAGTIYVEIR